MQTLTTENDILNALKSAVGLQTGKTDDEMIQLFDVTVAQKGEDFLRDQSLMRWAVRRISQLKKERQALLEHSFKTDTWLSEFLSDFEARWELGEIQAAKNEQMAVHYCAAAKYMESQGRREHIIDAVQDWIDGK